MEKFITYIAILALFIVSNLSQVCNTPPYSLSSILQNLMQKKRNRFQKQNLNIRFPGKLHSLLVITHAEVTTKNGLKYQREVSVFVHTYEQFHFGKFDSSSVIV
jgi:hypothetical protein